MDNISVTNHNKYKYNGEIPININNIKLVCDNLSKRYFSEKDFKYHIDNTDNEKKQSNKKKLDNNVKDSSFIIECNDKLLKFSNLANSTINFSRSLSTKKTTYKQHIGDKLWKYILIFFFAFIIFEFVESSFIISLISHFIVQIIFEVKKLASFLLILSTLISFVILFLVYLVILNFVKLLFIKVLFGIIFIFSIYKIGTICLLQGNDACQTFKDTLEYNKKLFKTRFSGFFMNFFIGWLFIGMSVFSCLNSLMKMIRGSNELHFTSNINSIKYQPVTKLKDINPNNKQVYYGLAYISYRLIIVYTTYVFIKDILSCIVVIVYNNYYMNDQDIDGKIKLNKLKIAKNILEVLGSLVFKSFCRSVILISNISLMFW
eukprot:jgi/Orpsp1_1/1188398/evm.model.d7180000064470.1